MGDKEKCLSRKFRSFFTRFIHVISRSDKHNMWRCSFRLYTEPQFNFRDPFPAFPAFPAFTRCLLPSRRSISYMDEICLRVGVTNMAYHADGT